MEAPKPINFSYIRKDITSEQGHKCSFKFLLMIINLNS